MKKLLLLALVVIGGVGNAFAEGEIYLRNNISTNWSTDDPNFKSDKSYDGSQDVYEFTINATTLGNKDFFFRINRYDSDGKLIGPYNHKDYTFKFENGQNETYTAPRISQFQDDDNGAFCIEHSKIKANNYKITIYLKYNESVIVDDNSYSNIWVYYIKAEIVDIPAQVSSLGYSTFSCDRALDLDNASTGLTAYKASVSEGKVVLTKATGKVEAGTGLLLAGTTGTIPVVETSAASALDGNLLHGAVTETNIAASTEGAYHYFLAGTTTDNIGFYNLASAADCAAGKAYLETTTELTSDPASSRVSWIFEDEPTGIQKVQAQSENCGSVFDLQGRRVAQPTKGLYIVNGKKVIK